MIFFPSTVMGMASQTRRLEELNAKSRTLIASNVQVFLPFDLSFAFSNASDKVTISTGSEAVCAFCQRAICAALRTAAALRSSPVDATM